MRILSENRPIYGDFALRPYACPMTATTPTQHGDEGASEHESDVPAGLAAESRVLVIEDEPGIVHFVRRGLESAGFVVEAALDGVEGERLGVGGSFDAVVLDMMLPG